MVLYSCSYGKFLSPETQVRLNTILEQHDLESRISSKNIQDIKIPHKNSYMSSFRASEHRYKSNSQFSKKIEENDEIKISVNSLEKNNSIILDNKPIIEEEIDNTPKDQKFKECDINQQQDVKKFIRDSVSRKNCLLFSNDLSRSVSLNHFKEYRETYIFDIIYPVKIKYNATQEPFQYVRKIEGKSIEFYLIMKFFKKVTKTILNIENIQTNNTNQNNSFTNNILNDIKIILYSIKIMYKKLIKIKKKDICAQIYFSTIFKTLLPLFSNYKELLKQINLKECSKLSLILLKDALENTRSDTLYVAIYTENYKMIKIMPEKDDINEMYNAFVDPHQLKKTYFYKEIKKSENNACKAVSCVFCFCLIPIGSVLFIALI